MIRTIQTDEITKNIKEMCIQANHYLSADMDAAMKHAADTEQSELGKKILHQLQDNLKIADEEMIPICQDTGMAVIFLEVGQTSILRAQRLRMPLTRESVRDTQKDSCANPLSVIRSFVKIQKITRRQSFIIPSCRAIR